jgi:ABC-2 type transport system permease protein
LHPLSRLGELVRARYILSRLIGREVKVKYKSSVLGAAWSMLNPVLYLAVFSLVFTVILRNDIPHFPVYLLSGLIAWTLFSSSLSLSVRSVVDNSSLVTRVYFPRELLPLSSMGSALVDFSLQALVLIVFMLAFRYGEFGMNLLLLPLSLFALLAFTVALALFVAALNVRYRDVQHLVNILLLAWFWMTPVVYPSSFVSSVLGQRHLFGISLYHLFLINPLADIVFGFQRAIYGTVRPVGASTTVLLPVSVGWLAVLISAVAVGSLLLLLLTWRVFFRMSGDFAEEL